MRSDCFSKALSGIMFIPVFGIMSYLAEDTSIGIMNSICGVLYFILPFVVYLLYLKDYKGQIQLMYFTMLPPFFYYLGAALGSKTATTHQKYSFWYTVALFIITCLLYDGQKKKAHAE